MKTASKSLGIWMDHSSAHLMDFEKDLTEERTISSTFTPEVKSIANGKGESIMHNKEQQQQAAYYNNLGDAIISYEDVVLFGPTNAKVELFNVLRSDLRFDKIKFTIIQADKMTDNQQVAFVKNHFSKS